jgi:hypothetical protein
MRLRWSRRRIWFHWVRPPVIRSSVARAIALQYSRLLLLGAAAPSNPGWIVDARTFSWLSTLDLCYLIVRFVCRVTILFTIGAQV